MGRGGSTGVPAEPFEKPFRYRGEEHDAMTPLSASDVPRNPNARHSSTSIYRTDRKTRPVVARFSRHSVSGKMEKGRTQVDGLAIWGENDLCLVRQVSSLPPNNQRRRATVARII